ncbi:hypothetical protein RAS1_37200 [Phycisphaerae bacterium RAS1]|nr:hypothetical protein RAS1_37200 [Phycisphaerae bacterium RAS1]
MSTFPVQQNGRLSAKEAAAHAAAFLRELLATPKAELRLDEVELSDDDRVWRITLSYLGPADPGQSGFAEFLHKVQDMPGSSIERIYKLVEVDAHTGEVRAVRIRRV